MKPSTPKTELRPSTQLRKAVFGGSLLTAWVLTIWLTAPQSHAQGTTAFTYQGQLRDGGTNANGAYTMIFKLYDAASGGMQIGSDITNSPTLANGLFSVNLDFGQGAFNGNGRWLEITVAGDTLTPLVQVLPSPYALYAATAATVIDAAITNPKLAANAVAGTNIQRNAVTEIHIADESVTNSKLTTNAVATANIQNGAVTNPKLAIPAVAGVNIFNEAITSEKISDGNVTDAKISSVSGSKVSGAVASANFATRADSASNANFATSAGSATNAEFATDAGAVNGFRASSTPLPNRLLPLDGNGRFPPSVLSNIVSSSEGSMRVIRGFVAAQGTAVLGESEFTVSQPVPGYYRVRFSTPFSEWPVITLSAVSDADEGSADERMFIVNLVFKSVFGLESGFDVWTARLYHLDTPFPETKLERKGTDWSFIAIGPP